MATPLSPVKYENNKFEIIDEKHPTIEDLATSLDPTPTMLSTP